MLLYLSQEKNIPLDNSMVDALLFAKNINTFFSIAFTDYISRKSVCIVFHFQDKSLCDWKIC